MKKFAMVIGMAAALVSGAAHADGFVCGTHDGKLTIRVYNHTQPTAGTRNAAVMVVSDKQVGVGNKTIGTFKDTEATLNNSGAYYVADVQEFLNQGGRGGEYIGGTRLSQLSKIRLAINFSYARPVPAAQLVNGMLTLRGLDGRTNSVQVGCSRYLKN